MTDISLDIRILRATRNNVKKLITTHSLSQINHIPKGFNNNLAWNLAHILVTQQLLCYGLSKLDMNIDSNIIDAYRKGTKPSKHITQAELDLFISLLDSNIEKIDIDYKKGIFEIYNPYTTSYDITLNNIEEAIRFNNVHEGLHFGTCLDIRKFL